MSNLYKNNNCPIDTIIVPSNESMQCIENMAARTLRTIFTHARFKHLVALLLVPAILIPIMGFIEKTPEQSYSGVLNLNALELLPLKNESGKTESLPNSGVIAMNNKIDAIYQKTAMLEQKELVQIEDKQQAHKVSTKYRVLEKSIKENPNFILTNSHNAQALLSPYLLRDKHRPGKNTGKNFSSRKKAIAPYVNRYADKFGLDRNLVMSIIQVESNFITHALSKQNAHGLMQVVPNTAAAEVNRFFKHKKEISSMDLMHPENNIYYGTAYLYLIRRYHLNGVTDHDSMNYLLIASYNAGSAAILRHFGATKEKAISKINAMNSEEVYRSLTQSYRSGETRTYLRRVTENLS